MRSIGFTRCASNPASRLRARGKIVYANCKIDNHVVGWRTPVNSAWYEYNNTDLSGKAVKFNGTQLTAGSAVLTAAGSAQGWLGWSP